MKFVAILILSGLLLFMAFQIYIFWGKERQARADYLDIKAKLDQAQLDQTKFGEELNYYLNPANLEKELRARFNYKLPGEKMIIIVPSAATSSTGTAP